jgi:hypothetical protein
MFPEALLLHGEACPMTRLQPEQPAPHLSSLVSALLSVSASVILQ